MMSTMKTFRRPARLSILALVAAAILPSAPLVGQDAPRKKEAPERKKPYAAGDEVNDATLRGLDGTEAHLLPLMKDKTVVLSFFQKG